MTFGSDLFLFFFILGVSLLAFFLLRHDWGLFGCVKDDDDAAHQALNLLVSLQDVLLLNLSRVIICASTVFSF